MNIKTLKIKLKKENQKYDIYRFKNGDRLQFSEKIGFKDTTRYEWKRQYISGHILNINELEFDNTGKLIL